MNKGSTFSPREIEENISNGVGEPLDVSLRTYFEPRMGCDFGGVRIRTDNIAAALAGEMNAEAFTFRRSIFFGEGRYEPHTVEGRRLIAHELAHVVQQSGGTGEAETVRRVVLGDITQMSINESFAGALTDDELTGQIAIVRRQMTILDEGSPEHDVARSNLSILETESRRRGVTAAESGVGEVSPEGVEEAIFAPGPTAQQAIPVDVVYNLYPLDEEGTILLPGSINLAGMESGEGSMDWGADLTRSTAIGGARGMGYLLSPPVSTTDAFLPLMSRMGGGEGALGRTSAGTYILERYVDSMGHLRPRYPFEAEQLYVLERLGQSPWMNSAGITERELSTIPELFRMASEGGIESLGPAEQALFRNFFRAHAESGITLASPVMSTTMQPGLSAMENVAPFIREYQYVVRIEVPESAVGEVNVVLNRSMPSPLETSWEANMARELEVLVTTDARGNVTSVRPNPTSSLGRAAPALRWGGRALIVVGAGVTAYRIGTATPEERPRVIGEEAGGWAGGFGGAALVAAGCVALGVPTGGISILLCGLVGGIAGGLGGSYVGGEVGEAVGPNPVERAATWAVDRYTEEMLQSENETTRHDAVAIRRAVFDDDPMSWMYLMYRMAGL